MDIKRITNKDRKLIYEYNVTVDDLEEICKDLPDFKEDDIKDVLTKNKCVLKKVNDAYTLYIGDKLWKGNIGSDEETLDSPNMEAESPTKE